MRWCLAASRSVSSVERPVLVLAVMAVMAVMAGEAGEEGGEGEGGAGSLSLSVTQNLSSGLARATPQANRGSLEILQLEDAPSQ